MLIHYVVALFCSLILYTNTTVRGIMLFKYKMLFISATGQVAKLTCEEEVQFLILQIHAGH